MRTSGSKCTRIALAGALGAISPATCAAFRQAVAAAPDSSTVAPQHHTIAGKLEIRSIESLELGERRRLYVLLPADYEASLKERYGVVYAQDGQDLFDEATAAGHEEWALDELLQAEPQGLPHLVVVGIESGPESRLDVAPPGSCEGARGDRYARFVAREVKPFIDRTYRTRADARHAVWIGEGASGLAALYGTWTYPGEFGAAVALSLPDLDEGFTSWANEPPGARGPGAAHAGRTPRREKHQSAAPPPLRVWIEQRSTGSALSSTTELVTLLRRYADVRVVVAGRDVNRLVRLAAALRALVVP